MFHCPRYTLQVEDHDEMSPFSTGRYTNLAHHNSACRLRLKRFGLGRSQISQIFRGCYRSNGLRQAAGASSTILLCSTMNAGSHSLRSMAISTLIGSREVFRREPITLDHFARDLSRGSDGVCGSP